MFGLCFMSNWVWVFNFIFAFETSLHVLWFFLYKAVEILCFLCQKKQIRERKLHGTCFERKLHGHVLIYCVFLACLIFMLMCVCDVRAVFLEMCWVEFGFMNLCQDHPLLRRVVRFLKFNFNLSSENSSVEPFTRCLF